MLLVAAFTLAILTPPFAQSSTPAPLTLTNTQCGASDRAPFVISPRYGIGWVEGQVVGSDGSPAGQLIYSPKYSFYYVLPNASMPSYTTTDIPNLPDWVPIASKQHWDATTSDGFSASSMLPWPGFSVRIGDLGCSAF